MTVILDTPEAISFYQLAALKGACKLELKGLRHSSGRSAIAHAKRTFGLKGSRESIVAQLEAMVEARIAARHTATPTGPLTDAEYAVAYPDGNPRQDIFPV